MVTILRIDQGIFTYSLDDPYIHLALAQRIAQGFYGINPGQIAAPSSSVLWPFLMALFAWTSFFEYIPLALNLVFAAATVWVYREIAFLVLDGLSDGARKLNAALIAILLIPTTNLIGLVYTGMEHSLQVLLCAAIVLGLVRALRGQPVPGWLWAALILAPLTRYECLVVSLPALGILFLCGHRKPALLTLAGLVVPLAAFSLFLYFNGLGWLPTSVLAKVANAHYRPTENFFLDHVRFNLEMRQGVVLAWMALPAVALALFRKNAPWIERLLALITAAMLLAHLASGQVGWADRYEVYMLTTAVLLVLFLSRGLLVYLYRHIGTLLTLGLLAILSFAISRPYYGNLVLTPWQVTNIYEQQYQMHRFVVDYLKAPVAVNDLGYVAYNNPETVLDLWGLASIDALESRTRSGWDTSWMDALTRREKVQLVMIYETWFSRLPGSWIPVARLYLGRPQTVAGGSEVTFFVLDANRVEPTLALLRQFSRTLPPGVRLDILR